MSGYSDDELVGMYYGEKLKFIYETSGDENTEFVDRVYEQGETSEMKNHTALVRNDGTRISVADSASPLKDLEGRVAGCVVVFRDVTKAREIEKMKDEFISIASHQLRTPLTAINWSAERLQKEKTGPLNDLQGELVQDMRDSTIRLITLVNDLLNVSRIESGRIIVEPSPTNLVELIKTVIADASVRVDEKDQKIVTDFDSSISDVNVDPKMIRQVVQNMIINASKYTQTGGEIKVKLFSERDKAVFRVQDNGSGIPEAEQSKLFQKFFRASNANQMDSDGTGLGLYLAKKIIEVSGGEIGFKSPLLINDSGQTYGTEFWFSLPLSGSQSKSGEITLM